MACLAVGLALLDLVVQLENGLAILLDVRPEVRPILTLDSIESLALPTLRSWVPSTTLSAFSNMVYLRVLKHSWNTKLTLIYIVDALDSIMFLQQRCS